MILDTNAISDLAENNWTLVEMVEQDTRATLPFIAVAEYQMGLLSSTRPQEGQAILDGLIEILPVLWAGSQTIRQYAEIANELKKRGRPIPTNDLWIAALARQHDMPILSRDSHFDHVPGVQRIAW